MIARKGTRITFAVLLLFVVLLGSIGLYYNLALGAQNASIGDLESAIAELREKNRQLEKELSSREGLQGGASIQGLDPVQIYRNSNRSVVTIEGAKTTIVDTIFGRQRIVANIVGSGFVVQYSSTYYTVTNFHVLDGVTNVTVTFWNGDVYRARVVGSDAYSDIAVVSVEAPTEEFYPLELTSSSSLRVGDAVVAIGNPFGLSGSITLGIVSQLGRTIEYESGAGGFAIADVIQFSAPINPGNSGGPLLDSDGAVVGITTAVVSGSQGVGFAIPSDTLLRELPLLIKTGGYNMHPFLGIQGVDMSYRISQAIGSNVSYGVLVERSIPGGPASKAGMKGGQQRVEIQGQQYVLGGDIIVSIDGTRIVNNDALSTYLERNTLPGQTIEIGIVRSRSFMLVELVLAARSSPV